MKQIILSLVGILAIVSCTNQPQAIQPTLTMVQLTSFASPPRPYITATPIQIDASQNITRIIDTLFNQQLCTKLDYLTPIAPAAPQDFLGYQVGKPEFIEIPNQLDFPKTLLEEIADNITKSFRAYLVHEPEITNSCSTCIQSRIYVQDQISGQTYKIDWKGYLPSRVIGRLIWVGDNVLTFFQSIGPHSDELIGINVEKQEFIYYAGLSCY